jgi:hypothetical protein
MRFTVIGAFDPLYCGFYIEGMRRLGQVRYRRGGPAPNEIQRFQFEADDRRIAINPGDMPFDDVEAKEWADVYGAVNPGADEVPIGPSFGVRAWTGTALLRRLPSVRSRHQLGLLVAQHRRPSERDYRPSTSDPGYVFQLASQWRREPETNEVRARFCRVAAKVAQFDGGFAPRSGGKSFVPSDLIVDRIGHAAVVRRLATLGR